MANNGLLSFDEFEDIITYMMDVTATISCFVEYYPPACAAFVNRDIPSKYWNFVIFAIDIISVRSLFYRRITDLYEKSVPYLCRTLEFLEDATPAQKRRLSDDLNSARRFLLQAYNLMLHSVSIKPLLNEKYLAVVETKANYGDTYAIRLFTAGRRASNRRRKSASSDGLK